MGVIKGDTRSLDCSLVGFRVEGLGFWVVGLNEGGFKIRQLGKWSSF